MKDNHKHIGLLFGSFNPIHEGHIALAEEALLEKTVDEVWFVVSPQNPQKDKKTLASFEDRVNMVEIAIEGLSNISVSKIEEYLSVPSYTYHTLELLREQHPEYIFSIIGGSDILETLHTWKNSVEIILHHDFIVRSRNKEPIIIPEGVRVKVLSGIKELSATLIRQDITDQILEKESINPLVIKYIKENQLYK